jgi:tetratricopeptide (TPR) repeat protein
LGAFLALSEEKEEIQEAFTTLQKAVDIDPRFFDAQYAFASVSLRLAVLNEDESLLVCADKAFSEASTLLQTVPAEFYWHAGIVWSVIGKYSEEPCDCKEAILRYEKAKLLGCSRPDFYNDYANALVELSLAISNDEGIFQAISLYTNAIAASENVSQKVKSVWMFNLGCCCQHIFEKTSEKEFFQKGLNAFEIAASLHPDLPMLWQKWGILLFRGWRVWLEFSLAKDALSKLHEAEKRGEISSVGSALMTQVLLWLSVSEEEEQLCATAAEYAEKAMALQIEGGEEHPEVFAAYALCYYERGKYFEEASFLERALEITQGAITTFPKSAILWHTLAYVQASLSDMNADVAIMKDAIVSFTIASRSLFAFSPRFYSDWAEVLLALAEISEDVSFVYEAIQKLERVCELEGERRISFLYHMGHALHVLGDLCDEEEYYSRSIAFLTEAYLQDDKSLPILYQMASCYLHMAELTLDANSFVMARLFYEELLTLDPENEAAWSDYALALIHIGKAHKVNEEIPQEWFYAEDALYTARGLGQPYAMYHLAALYVLMGNYEEAIDALYDAFDEGELPDVDDILADEWLEPLTQKTCFHNFLQQIQTEMPPLAQEE